VVHHTITFISVILHVFHIVLQEAQPAGGLLCLERMPQPHSQPGKGKAGAVLCSSQWLSAFQCSAPLTKVLRDERSALDRSSSRYNSSPSCMVAFWLTFHGFCRRRADGGGCVCLGGGCLTKVCNAGALADCCHCRLPVHITPLLLFRCLVKLLDTLWERGATRHASMAGFA
jgi:hypothetical protein